MKSVKENLIILIVFLSLFTSAESHSQIKNLGIKIGLNLTNASIEPETSFPATKNRTGFNITTFYEFMEFGNVSFSLEAGYSQKGYDNIIVLTNQFGENIGEEKLHHRLDYIDVSLISKFMIETKYIKPYLSIGPVIGINTGYTLSYSNPANQGGPGNTILEDLTSTSLGIKLGAGMELGKLFPFIVFIEGRYNPDLTYSYNTNGIKYKNKSAEINLGIKF